MLIHVDRRQFSVLVAEKEVEIPARCRYVGLIMVAYFTKWITELDTQAQSVFLCLVGKTVALGREAALLSMKHFSESHEIMRDGGEIVSLGALNMVRNTIKDRLQWLADNNFISTYCTGQGKKISQNEPRLYEINFKRMLTYDGCTAENYKGMLDTEQLVIQEKQARLAQKIGNRCHGMTPSAQKLSNRCHGMTPDPYINTYIDNIYMYKSLSSNVVPTVFDASGDIIDFSEKVAEKGEGSLKSISIPKKARALPVRIDSIEGVLATAKVKRTEVAATRIAQATAGKVTIASIQATLDSAMRDCYPTLPRLIVTAKAFGVLRKRLESATVHNIPEFINFSIREWTLIAGRNRAAFLRNPSKAQQGSPLSSAPTFNELAFKLPYFLSVYSQSLSTAVTGKEASSDARVERLQAKLETAERENQNNKEIIRRIRHTPREATTTGRTSGKTLNVSNRPKEGLLDGWTPPTWQSAGDKNGK